MSVKEIFRIGGDFLKPSTYEALSAEPGPTVFSTSDPAYHSRWRKLLGGAMSESSLKNLQFVVQSKVDLLMAKLKEERSTKGYMDVFRWNHFFTTDVIAELSFGQSFETLEKGEVSIRKLDGASPSADEKGHPICPGSNETDTIQLSSSYGYGSDGERDATLANLALYRSGRVELSHG